MLVSTFALALALVSAGSPSLALIPAAPRSLLAHSVEDPVSAGNPVAADDGVSVDEEDSVSLQPPLPEAVAPPPEGERAPQSFLIAAHGGGSLRLCATGTDCQASLGPSVGMRVEFRLSSWFSLGLDADWVRFHEDLGYDAFSVSHQVDALRALLLARVHWLYAGAHDVSTAVGVGYGLGRASARGSDFETGASSAWQGLSQGPLGRATLTWLWRSPLRIQIGPELALDYWYDQDSLFQQRSYQQSVGCGETRSGCLLMPSLWARENLAWSLRLVVGVPLGGRF
jgi:hypothetical protein